MLVYDGFDTLGCWVSEKYDGICAIWNGTELRTRDGNLLHAPTWFTSQLPNCELQGEIWCGRGQFEQVLSICRSHNSGYRWRLVRFMVFSGPQLPLGEYAAHIVRWPAVDPDADRDRIVAMNGEGIVIRDCDGIDHKHKPEQDDDAVVIGHAAGKGRHTGRLGALIVRDRSGLEFRIGTGLSDNIRTVPPAVGAVVEFSYQGRTRTGKPRFAAFKRARMDMPN